MKQLKNDPRFWIMSITGGVGTLLIVWITVIKLSNPAWMPSPILVWSVEILFFLFLFCGFKGNNKPRSK